MQSCGKLANRRSYRFEGSSCPYKLLRAFAESYKEEKKKGKSHKRRKINRETKLESMVSREHKKAALHEKLQLLRSITNSHALNKASIIVDASKYIEELKQKVERLNQDISTVQNSINQNPLPMVTVETLVKGFSINVFSEKSCPGLLVSILEGFEELGLNVLEARVSCTETFQLQAVGEVDEQGGGIDAQAVKEAVVQAIKNWSESSEQD